MKTFGRALLDHIKERFSDDCGDFRTDDPYSRTRVMDKASFVRGAFSKSHLFYDLRGQAFAVVNEDAHECREGGGSVA